MMPKRNSDMEYLDGQPNSLMNVSSFLFVVVVRKELLT